LKDWDELDAEFVKTIIKIKNALCEEKENVSSLVQALQTSQVVKLREIPLTKVKKKSSHLKIYGIK